MKQLLLLVLTLGFLQIAEAGEASGVIVQVELGPLYGDKVFIAVTGPTGQPACQSGIYQFVFDANATGGKETLAAVLSAQASQKTVAISGFGTCTLQQGVEDLRWFRIQS